jgi:hypothetical protein
MNILGLPTKEIKATVEHADALVLDAHAEMRAVTAEAKATLATLRRVAENLEAITAVIRAAAQGIRPQG